MDIQCYLVSQDINPNRTPVNVAINLPDELFPVRSPLLRDSQLISFPSLTNMLKVQGVLSPDSGYVIINQLIKHKAMMIMITLYSVSEKIKQTLKSSGYMDQVNLG